MAPKTTLSLIIVLFLTAFTGTLKAQDSIIRINGDLIYGKVTEIGTNAISYKKSGMDDGPVYTEELKTIAYIRYKNGAMEHYGKLNIPVKNIAAANTNNTKLPPALAGSTTEPEMKKGERKLPEPGPTENIALKNGPVSNQYRVEKFDKKFMINGEKVSGRAVDKLLAKSTNPAVVAMAKTAKLVKTFQKISKITSYPTTIGGGFASVSTFTRMYKRIEDEGASFAACKDFGISFLTTMTLPITSKILGSKKDKLYAKAIDLYNMQN